MVDFRRAGKIPASTLSGADCPYNEVGKIPRGPSRFVYYVNRVCPRTDHYKRLKLKIIFLEKIAFKEKNN
jgi:hypothetical protein